MPSGIATTITIAASTSEPKMACAMPARSGSRERFDVRKSLVPTRAANRSNPTSRATIPAPSFHERRNAAYSPSGRRSTTAIVNSQPGTPSGSKMNRATSSIGRADLTRPVGDHETPVGIDAGAVAQDLPEQRDDDAEAREEGDEQHRLEHEPQTSTRRPRSARSTVIWCATATSAVAISTARGSGARRSRRRG